MTTTKVIITEPEKHFGFILFNHIYNREKDEFIIEDLQDELTEKYGLSVNKYELQYAINCMVINGILDHTVVGFKKAQII